MLLLWKVFTELILVSFDFRPAFYMYAVMVGIAAAVVLCVSLDFKPPAKSLIKDIKVVLKNVELDVFFLVHFMSGKCKLGPHYDQHTLMYLPSKFHPIPTIG